MPVSGQTEMRPAASDANRMRRQTGERRDGVTVEILDVGWERKATSTPRSLPATSTPRLKPCENSERLGPVCSAHRGHDTPQLTRHACEPLLLLNATGKRLGNHQGAAADARNTPALGAAGCAGFCRCGRGSSSAEADSETCCFRSRSPNSRHSSALCLRLRRRTPTIPTMRSMLFFSSDGPWVASPSQWRTVSGGHNEDAAEVCQQSFETI